MPASSALDMSWIRGNSCSLFSLAVLLNQFPLNVASIFSFPSNFRLSVSDSLRTSEIWVSVCLFVGVSIRNRCSFSVLKCKARIVQLNCFKHEFASLICFAYSCLLASGLLGLAICFTILLIFVRFFAYSCFYLFDVYWVRLSVCRLSISYCELHQA